MLRGGADANLFAQVRDIVRKKHYPIRTEQSYVNLIKHYIILQRKHQSQGVGEKEISHHNYLYACHSEKWYGRVPFGCDVQGGNGTDIRSFRDSRNLTFDVYRLYFL
jgi:hypothetical protein